jgi:DNA/RNA endonuclease YhcR with UshA esterase domain
MVEAKGRAVLTDFGIAWAAQEERLTMAGATVGTPQYMAPEQVLAQEVGPPTDLYALGVVIYELLAGVVPFDSPSTTTVMHQQVYHPLPPIRTKNPNLPATVEAVLQRALTKAPAERYENGADLIDAISRGLRGEVVEEPRPRPQTTPSLLAALTPPVSPTGSAEASTAAASPAPTAWTWRSIRLPAWAWAAVAGAFIVGTFLLVRALTDPVPPAAPATVSPAGATPGPSPVLPTAPSLQDIGSLDPADVGQSVWVEAEIAGFDPFSSGVRFDLDDGTGQIVLLLWQSLYEQIPYGEGLDAGARIRVHGKVEEYQGTLEVIPNVARDVIILVAARSPQAASVASLSAADVGRMVRLEGTLSDEIPFSQGVRYHLNDGTGQIVLVLWNRVGEHAPAGLGPGTIVRLTGEIGEYRGNLEVVPRRGTDIEVVR